MGPPGGERQPLPFVSLRDAVQGSSTFLTLERRTGPSAPPRDGHGIQSSPVAARGAEVVCRDIRCPEVTGCIGTCTRVSVPGWLVTGSASLTWGDDASSAPPSNPRSCPKPQRPESARSSAVVVSRICHDKTSTPRVVFVRAGHPMARAWWCRIPSRCGGWRIRRRPGRAPLRSAIPGGSGPL